MDLILWLAVQLLIIALVSWFVIARRRKAEGVVPCIKSSHRDDNREFNEIQKMRARSLNIPLSEISRPVRMDDIIGQQEGIKALRAALCGPNPQHVIIYGPPGVGKTCAARLVLEEAKANPESPFNEESKFVEIDATCVRFDERSIADPLMGSVHDPIYQGAGTLGVQGIPQPKPGAVSRAHCGVLFIDEIGELHPIQMNKLLKVLEDRCVFFESSYYSESNTSIPQYIHDIFKNGLPADFRLVGATTRMPEDLPPALRSRCVELFFKPLGEAELTRITKDAVERIGFSMEEQTAELCASYAASGRDAVNIVQLASGVAHAETRTLIQNGDVMWVASTCNYVRHMQYTMREKAFAGMVCGLGVAGGGLGTVIEIECTARPAKDGEGSLSITGMAEEEELEMRSKKLRRKSTAYASVENVLNVFFNRFDTDCRNYHISYNIPGGIPMDGPSAGIAIAVALMSAITGKAPMKRLALTGEITMHGNVRPVGGVREKVAAAVDAGAQTVIIPADNWEESLSDFKDLEIILVSDISEVMKHAFELSQETEPCELLELIFTA